MQKAIKITKDVLGVVIFVGMSYFLIKWLLLGKFAITYWHVFGKDILFAILSVSITGLSLLFALKKLL